MYQILSVTNVAIKHIIASIKHIILSIPIKISN